MMTKSLVPITFFGMEVIQSDAACKRHMVPRPRSPSRARRRAAKGHPQHHTVMFEPTAFELGGKLFIHPSLYPELRQRVEAQERFTQNERQMDGSPF